MLKKYIQENKRKMQGGQAVIIAVLFFLTGSFLVVTGVTSPTLKEISKVRTLMESKQSYFVAESGAEDAIYRLSHGLELSNPEVTTFASSTVSVTNADLSLEEIEIIAIGDNNARIRTVRVLIRTGIGATFFYGVQSDVGGIQLDNNSGVLGNAFSNGPIKGEKSNLIDGDAISSGPLGLIDNIHATGTAWAHTINSSIVDKDAHYQVISNSTVAGTEYPGAPDLATGGLPISDSLIEEWEQIAKAGGIITSSDPLCSGGIYVLNSDTILGPVKIECDLEVSGNSTLLTLAGNVWVEGNIIFKNSPTITTDLALGAKSVVMITDDPTDRATGSTIEIQNSFFVDHSFEGSHILLISQNNSNEIGGNNIAIDVKNNAEGDFLVYAGHGEILIQNNATLTEVSGYKIHLKNNSLVLYETGLRNLLFTSGPSGAYVVDSWGEI